MLNFKFNIPFSFFNSKLNIHNLKLQATSLSKFNRLHVGYFFCVDFKTDNCFYFMKAVDSGSSGVYAKHVSMTFISHHF